MFNRKSNFTLIELIVVIVVLGILAAIVIPNISSFSDEARDVQLTADARNMQTAVDMYRAKSDSGTADPVLDKVVFEATHERIVVEGNDEYTNELLVDSAAAAAPQTFKLLNTDELKDKHLRKLPKYVKNAEFLGTDTTAGEVELTYDVVAAEVNFDKGQVIAGILQGADGKSTAIVKFVAPVDGVDSADVAQKGLSVIR